MSVRGSLTSVLSAIVGGLVVIMFSGGTRFVEADQPVPKKGLAGEIEWLRQANPPVGSVTAFAGPWPPRRAGGVWTEQEIGWLLCDKRAWDDKTLSSIPKAELEELKTVLGTPHLPDLRGQFLRGVDAGIDGKSTSSLDKGGIRTVGSNQGYSTARPSGKEPFVTGKQSDNPSYERMKWVHHHVFQTGKGESATYFDKDKFESHKTSGDHTHTIEKGGDPETRPVNVAVYWIIKYKHTTP